MCANRSSNSENQKRKTGDKPGPPTNPARIRETLRHLAMVQYFCAKVGVNRPLLFGNEDEGPGKRYNNPRNKSRSGWSNPGPSSSSCEYFFVDFDDSTALLGIDGPLSWHDDPGAGSRLAGVGCCCLGAGRR